jgi:hypothetical protein
MATTLLNPIFFQYPLIGSNTAITGDFTVQRRNDTINPTEMLNYMFKKQFGIPNVLPYTNYANDEFIPTTAINNSPLDKQYSQEIPKQPPSDINMIRDITFNTNNLYNSNSERYISRDNPYMVYYKNINMISLSSESFYAGTYNSIGNIRFYLTKNAISPFYGNDQNIPLVNKYYSKLIVEGRNITTETISETISVTDPETGEITQEIIETEVTTVTGYTNLAFDNKNAGSWLLDCDTGILTFYDNVLPSIATVNQENPPRISFWRYEGLIGNNTVMTVGDF